ncbi:hypothetical protein LPJ71_007878, partial [Coemansia sp. S17]
VQALNRIRKLSQGSSGRSLSDSSSASDKERSMSCEMDVEQDGVADGSSELPQQQSPQSYSPPVDPKDPKDSIPGSWAPQG